MTIKTTKDKPRLFRTTLAFKLFYYIGFSTLIIAGLISLLYWILCDFEKAVSITETIIQTMAIFIGGLWAYNKFGWEKKAESAIRLKAMMLNYSQFLKSARSQYEIDKQNNRDDAYFRYSMATLETKKQIISQIHLSCYIPKELRYRIFDALGSLGLISPDNDPSRWTKFGNEMTAIEEEPFFL